MLYRIAYQWFCIFGWNIQCNNVRMVWFLSVIWIDPAIWKAEQVWCIIDDTDAYTLVTQKRVLATRLHAVVISSCMIVDDDYIHRLHMPYNLVCCKAKWQIGLPNRNLHAGSQSCKAQVYKSLVLPILDYNHILKGYSILPPSLFTPIHPPPPPPPKP